MAKPKGIAKLIQSGIANQLGTGTHRVVVKAIRFKRNAVNQTMVEKETGAPRALEVVFQEPEGREAKWVETFWLSKAAMFRLENFCKAISINLVGNNKTPVEEVINKKYLYITIIAERYFYPDTGEVAMDSNGNFMETLKLRSFDVDLGVKPKYLGDPKLPDGYYLINKPWEESPYARRRT